MAGWVLRGSVVRGCFEVIVGGRDRIRTRARSVTTDAANDVASKNRQVEPDLLLAQGLQ